jgi:hypothetical protein
MGPSEDPPTTQSGSKHSVEALPVKLRTRLQSVAAFGATSLVFRLVGAVVLIFIGVYLEKNGVDLLSVLLVLAYLLVFGAWEILIYTTRREVATTAVRLHDRTTRVIADHQNRELTLADHAITFQNESLDRSTRVLLMAHPILMDPLNTARHLIIRRDSVLNETLQRLCQALKTAYVQLEDVTVVDVWFRATFLEVSGDELKYRAWWLPDGSAPRSAREHKTFRQGEGCAGLAWQRARPVIEDDFRDGHEWKDNYMGQGQIYKSMVSVPVIRPLDNGTSAVIGVITVDTNTSGYFGVKNNKDHEERAGRRILPYARYISFHLELCDLMANLTPTLSGDKRGSSG